eukprot:10038-Heterococcus_DN1.PRE.2
MECVHLFHVVALHTVQRASGMHDSCTSACMSTTALRSSPSMLLFMALRSQTVSCKVQRLTLCNAALMVHA